MTYEYMMGMGQHASGSIYDRIKAAEEAGNVHQWTPDDDKSSGGGTQLTMLTFIPGAISMQGATPVGTVATMPEERERLRQWACQYYGKTSEKCAKPGDQDFTYMEAAPLALFRNAQLSQAQLGRDYFDPVRAASAKGKTAVRARLPKFFAWWRRCSKSTWAYWMTQSGFGGTVVPVGAWNLFKKIDRTSGLPPCNRADIDKVFKIRRQWKASEMLASAPAQAGASPEAPIDTSAADKAESKQQEANAAQEQVAALENQLQQMQDMLNQALQGAGNAGSDDGTAALAAQVAALQEQLSNANSAREEVEREAEEAQMLADEEAESSFFGQYKWYMALGGFAVVGAGLWYYYFKYKPAQETAALGGE